MGGTDCKRWGGLERDGLDPGEETPVFWTATHSLVFRLFLSADGSMETTQRSVLQNVYVLRNVSRLFQNLFCILHNVFSILRHISYMLSDVFCVLQDIFHVLQDVVYMLQGIFRVVWDILCIFWDVFCVLWAIFWKLQQFENVAPGSALGGTVGKAATPVGVKWKLQYNGMTWVEKDLKDHLMPNPLPKVVQ